MTRPLHSDMSGGFAGSDSGSTLVEFAIVLPVFLLVFFGLVDFGRLGFTYMMAEKATAIAARIAVVRPAPCVGVPKVNVRGAVPSGSVPPYYGTKCSAGATICAAPGTVSCTGSAGDIGTGNTVDEIWSAVETLLPQDATPANLSFSYAYDSDLGFLGGPYVPMVTVELVGLDFNFIAPLASLASIAGAAAGSEPPGSLPFPPMSVTLPAEDLAHGEAS